MISILTPTFNRAYTLTRLFASLQSQTLNHFEWIVIDDGSTDNTKELINNYFNSNNIKITYFYQENQGKHVAINTGATKATGSWVLILDSDDVLTDDAIECIQIAIEQNSTENFIGFCFRRAYFNLKIIGNICTDSSPLILHPTDAVKHFQGDLAYIFRTDVLRLNPFPVFEDENFVPELYVWNKIADSGSICFFPCKSIYLSEYLPDGYSANFKSNLRRNPKGFGLFYRDQIIREKSLIMRIKYIIRSIQCFYYAIKKWMSK